MSRWHLQEAGASLTVNEYEPLLMDSDLRTCPAQPRLRFMADQGREVLSRPLSLPGKALRLPGKARTLANLSKWPTNSSRGSASS